MWFDSLNKFFKKAEKQHDNKVCFVLHVINHFHDMKGKLAYLQRRYIVVLLSGKPFQVLEEISSSVVVRGYDHQWF